MGPAGIEHRPMEALDRVVPEVDMGVDERLVSHHGTPRPRTRARFARRRNLGLGRREVEPHGEQVGTEPTNAGGVYRPTEAIEPRLRVVIRDDLSACRQPPAPHADAHGRIRLDVDYVASVASVLGHDPAGRALDMHSHHRASPLARASSDALDQDVARHETRSHGEHRRRVQEVALKEANGPPLAFGAVTGHAPMMPPPEPQPLEVEVEAPTCGRLRSWPLRLGPSSRLGHPRLPFACRRGGRRGQAAQDPGGRWTRS